MPEWFNDPSKVGATVLLLMAVVSLATGKFVVPRWMFDKVVSDCKTKDERIDRLLNAQEKQIEAQELTASTVAKVTRTRS